MMEMRIAVHGRLRSGNKDDRLIHILRQVSAAFPAVAICSGLNQALLEAGEEFNLPVINQHQLRTGNYTMLVSIGGDGTILEAARMVGNSGIPILGINNGRLGFLSSTPHEDTAAALNRLTQGDFIIEQRSLVQVSTSVNLFGKDNFSLNEITVHKSAKSSMIVVHAYLDGAFLNTYWADGLIISTPTGSTGYSLSAGGPILTPNSQSLIITPIAPHNLNVRPLVIPDNQHITLSVEGTAQDHLISLDSISCPLKPALTLDISKADFSVGLVRFHPEDYFNTLRSKLMWGIDRRN
jgi:NAD+ kinase